MSGIQDKVQDYKERLQDYWEDRKSSGNGVSKILIAILLIYLLIALIMGIIWSQEPDQFNVQQNIAVKAEEMGVEPVRGFASTATVMKITETLLYKPGAYLTNDILPPGIWLDNIPNWEFGALVQIRDFTRALRKDFSRSQSQSTEDNDLATAEPQFNFNNSSRILPSTESQYELGLRALNNYLLRLSDPNEPTAQFYARSDNLRQWLFDVETRLGSLSLRLSASVGQKRVNTDTDVPHSTPTNTEEVVQTPWLEIDDVFYEARGNVWALVHLLKAVEVDFKDVLEKKNALVSLRHIIRELEGALTPVWSPMILNGSGFGVFANHSLVMASYISRANAAIIDLRELLSQG